MATMALDHRFSAVTLDPRTALRVTLKYCELCRIQFICDKDEAQFPGDYVSLQRGAGKRAPIICPRCEVSGADIAFMSEEAREMNRIAMEIRAERDRFQASSPLRAGGARERAIQLDPKQQERKRRFAKWREPLMRAFKEHPEMTAQQIAAVMRAAGGGDFKSTSSAVYVARNAGVPIVRSNKTMNTGCCGRGHHYVHLFTLSTQEQPAPLTPPQDSETHQFMREIVESDASGDQLRQAIREAVS